MDDDESALSVSSGIPRARREPTIQVSESDARGFEFFLVITRVSDMFVNDAVGIQVRRVADPTVPTTVMPSKSR